MLRKYILIGTAFLTPFTLLAGGGAGNGGDIVHCQKSPENTLEGDYFLDYVVTYIKSNANADVLEPKSWEESRDRLLKGLKEKAPEMGKRFEEFVTLMDNLTDASKPRIWMEASFGLENVDPEIYRKVPPNCRKQDGKPDITRYLRRRVQEGQVVYEFDPALDANFKTARPLQYSMSRVHEFLWDYTDDLELVQRLNRILHSKNFDSYDAAAFQTILLRLGVGTTKLSANQSGHSQEELDKRLIIDIGLKNIEFVKHWLELGADVNARSEFKITALMNAAAAPSEEIALLLLDQGAFINAAEPEGRTALHFAAQSGLRKLVSRLVEKGVDLDQRAKDGRTALMVAMMDGKTEIALELINAGASLKGEWQYGTYQRWPAFHLAIKLGNEDIVRHFLKSGADANETMTDLVNPNGSYAVTSRNPIHTALRFNHPKLLSLLAEAGSDLNYVSDRTQTSLMMASLFSDANAISYLISKGADLEAVDLYKDRAIHYAVFSMKIENLRALMKAGANYRVTGEDDKNILEIAKQKRANVVTQQDKKAMDDMIAFITPFFVIQNKKLAGTGKAEKIGWGGTTCDGSTKKAAGAIALSEALQKCSAEKLESCQEDPKTERQFKAYKEEEKRICEATVTVTGVVIPTIPD